MRSWIAATLFLALPFLLPLAEAGKKAKGGEDPKEALQAVQEFIGGWKGTGSSEKNKSEIWKETASWSWRFKGKDVFLSVDMDTSKLYKHGELRYDPAKDKYELTLIDKEGTKLVFLGEMKKNVLTLDRLDPDSGDTQQLKLNTVADGDRLIMTSYVKPEGRTMFLKQFQLAYTKEGVTFGVEAGGKKPECVVTGGLGTMAVSYMGTTYYVCCSGCRDAFNENPAKILAEYKAKKRK